MGCNCGNKNGTARSTYEVTTPSGEKKVYSTEVEASAAARRLGGTYRKKP